MRYVRNNGFTLIELLIVMGILAVLAGIVLVAINPSRQFKQANDTRRLSDVGVILSALDQYAEDNKGSLDALNILTDTPVVIGNQPGELDICSDLVPTYIAALPSDPTSTISQGNGISDCSSSYDTGYSVEENGNTITVSAVSEVNPSVPIAITR